MLFAFVPKVQHITLKLQLVLWRRFCRMWIRNVTRCGPPSLFSRSDTLQVIINTESFDFVLVLFIGVRSALKSRLCRGNCAAIPQSLIAWELFEYEKGAFTGACNEPSGGLSYPSASRAAFQ